MTLYATLCAIFAGFVFTMTLAHPFPAKSATSILMALLDIVTNLSVDCTKINQMKKRPPVKITSGLKSILLEVAVQHALQSDAVTGLVAENPLFSMVFTFSTTDSTKSKNLMHENKSLSATLFVLP